ncbi:hypothetical protein [Amycolatopsis lexingtonensis]|uniref:hypothetical protein n=1 Tax=Amycolatopsis lexingtonensis TaxID=218822 RepID=UPI001B802B3A|nr:hypothetical protein [Amycolatopsis lexingtonensis]
MKAPATSRRSPAILIPAAWVRPSWPPGRNGSSVFAPARPRYTVPSPMLAV